MFGADLHLDMTYVGTPTFVLPVPVPVHLQAFSPWHLHLAPFDLWCYGFFLHGGHTGSQALSIVMSLQKSTSFLFALFFISVTTTKVLHLALHLGTIPLAAFFLYLPTFFIPDVILLIITRLLLRRERGVGSLVGLLLGVFISYVGRVSPHLGAFQRPPQVAGDQG